MFRYYMDAEGDETPAERILTPNLSMSQFYNFKG